MSAAPTPMQTALAAMQAAEVALTQAEQDAQAAQARYKATDPNAPVAGALMMAAGIAQQQAQQAGQTMQAASLAYSQAVMQAVVLSKEVSGIRVHNTGAFEMCFSIGFPDSSTSGNTATFGVGDERTISVAVTPPYLFNHATGAVWAPGTSIMPIAHIQDGAGNHGAEDMVTFNAASPNVAVYNCGGTCDDPNFSLQANSADVGDNGGLAGLESDDSVVSQISDPSNAGGAQDAGMEAAAGAAGGE